MKITRSEPGLSLSLNAQEVRIFHFVLEHFPAEVDPAQPRISRSLENPEANELLAQELKENYQGIQTIVTQLLERLPLISAGTAVLIKWEEVESVLQALNAIRLHHWKLLGSKTMSELHEAELPPSQQKSLGIMELSAFLQVSIIRAADGLDVG